jgi:hypothetical protein
LVTKGRKTNASAATPDTGVPVVETVALTVDEGVSVMDSVAAAVDAGVWILNAVAETPDPISSSAKMATTPRHATISR